MRSPFPSVLAGLATLLLLVSETARAYPYTEALAPWNINVNEAAGRDVLKYDSERGQGRSQTYTPSPDNWRALPFYNIFLDKFAVRPHRLLRWAEGAGVAALRAALARRARPPARLSLCFSSSKPSSSSSSSGASEPSTK